MPRPRDPAALDPRAYLRFAVDQIEQEAAVEAFGLLRDLAADAPPNLLFIEAGKARAVAEICAAMRQKITEAFRHEDDQDEGDER